MRFDIRKIRLARSNANLTAKELAIKTNLNIRTICRALNNRDIKPGTAIVIANALGIGIEELILKEV